MAPSGQGILSPLRLPFRHSPAKSAWAPQAAKFYKRRARAATGATRAICRKAPGNTTALVGRGYFAPSSAASAAMTSSETLKFDDTLSTSSWSSRASISLMTLRAASASRSMAVFGSLRTTACSIL